MSQWKEISLNSIKNIRIGHAQDEEHGTGCSVIICDKKAPCGVDVRAGKCVLMLQWVTRPVWTVRKIWSVMEM